MPADTASVTPLGKKITLQNSYSTVLIVTEVASRSVTQLPEEQVANSPFKTRSSKK